MADLSSLNLTTYRDYNVDGLPASLEYDPKKSDIRQFNAQLIAAIQSLAVANGIGAAFDTKATMDATLTYAAGTLAYVWNDSTPANNIIYSKTGASGSGSWTATTIALPVAVAAQVTDLLSRMDDVEGLKAPLLNPSFGGMVKAQDISINDNAGATRALRFTTGDVVRWQFIADGDAEGGANTGTNFSLRAAADDGSALGTVFSIERSTQVVAFDQTPTAPTASPGDNTEQVATTEYVQGEIANFVTSSTLTSGLSGKEPTITAGTTGQFWRGDKTWQAITKITVGLPNVDNTADSAKPVSTAQQTAIDAKVENSINGAHTTVAPSGSAVSAALDAKADAATTISAAGLATGGGSLAAGRTITVPKATQTDVATGTDDTKALTSLSVAAAFSGKVGTGYTLSTSGLATGGGDFSTARTISVPKAGQSDVATGTDDAKALTSFAVAAAFAARALTSTTVTGAGLATGGGALSANRTITVTAASQAEAAAGSRQDVALTPYAIAPQVAQLGTNTSAISTLSTTVGGHTTSIAANTTNIAALTVADRTRPGDATLLMFSSTLTGDPAGRADFAGGTVQVNDDLGSVVRIGPLIPASPGYIDLAPKRAFYVESGRTYRIRVSVRRYQDAVDPSGASIELRAQNLTKNKANVSNARIGNPYTPLAADGSPLVITAFVGKAGSPGTLDYTIPSSTIYFTPHIRVYDNSQMLDVGAIEWTDVTDTLSGADVAAKADKTIQISGAGLASGGGDLSTNRTVTVTAASQAEAAAATRNDVALTPLATAPQVAQLATNTATVAAHAATITGLNAATANLIQCAPITVNGRQAQPLTVSFDLFVTSWIYLDTSEIASPKALPDILASNYANLPPITISGRPARIRTLSYDLYVLQYEFIDTGEQVTAKAPVSPTTAFVARYLDVEPMLFNGRYIRPKTLSYDLYAIDYEYVDSGASVIAGVSSGSAPPAMKVIQTSGQLRIFMPAKTRYTEWVFRNDVDLVTLNQDVVHLREAWDSALAGYTPSRYQQLLKDQAEIETAVQTVAAGQFVGGYHGNQVKSAFTLLVDGTTTSLTQVLNYAANRIQAFQKSIVYQYGTTSTKLADVWTEWDFKGGQIRISVTITWAQAVAMQRTYLSGILPVLRSIGSGSGNAGPSVNIVTTGRRSPYYEAEDLSTSTYTQTPTKDAYVLSGNGAGGYGFRLEKTKGWTYPNRAGWYSPSVENKFYQDVYGSLTTTIGQTDTFESIIQIDNPY